MPSPIVLPADLGVTKGLLQSALDAQGEIPVGFSLD